MRGTQQLFSGTLWIRRISQDTSARRSFYSYCWIEKWLMCIIVPTVFRPFLKKGVVAPHQGFLPKYTSGLYVSESGVQMVVSRGLGSSIIPVRLNNRPHLPIIHLQ